MEVAVMVMVFSVVLVPVIAMPHSLVRSDALLFPIVPVFLWWWCGTEA